MKVQSLVDHRVARAILQQPEPYYTTMHPSWTNAHRDCTFQPRVGSTGYPALPI